MRSKAAAMLRASRRAGGLWFRDVKGFKDVKGFRTSRPLGDSKSCLGSSTGNSSLDSSSMSPSPLEPTADGQGRFGGRLGIRFGSWTFSTDVQTGSGIYPRGGSSCNVIGSSDSALQTNLAAHEGVHETSSSIPLSIPFRMPLRLTQSVCDGQSLPACNTPPSSSSSPSSYTLSGSSLSSQFPGSFLQYHTRSLSSRSMHCVSFTPLASANESASSGASSARLVPPSGFLPLNALQDRPGSREQKTRLGRGIGSGKGKTSGRGHKGQLARSGCKPRLGFEGGQTPLRLTLPKRGFHNPFSLEFQEVNLDTILRKISEGGIDPQHLITMKVLKDAGAVGKAMRDGVKLLGRGAKNVSIPMHIEVSRVSDQAKQAIEAAGGSVTRVHYNKLGLRALLKPEWFAKKGRLLPRPARPPPRLLGQVDAIGRLPAPTTPMPRTPEVPAA